MNSIDNIKFKYSLQPYLSENQRMILDLFEQIQGLGGVFSYGIYYRFYKTIEYKYNSIYDNLLEEIIDKVDDDLRDKLEIFGLGGMNFFDLINELGKAIKFISKDIELNYDLCEEYQENGFDLSRFIADIHQYCSKYYIDLEIDSYFNVEYIKKLFDFCKFNQKIQIQYDINKISAEINRIYSIGIKQKCEEIMPFIENGIDILQLEEKIFSLIVESYEQKKEIPNLKNEEFVRELIKECTIEK
jgi:hypothetical protein